MKDTQLEEKICEDAIHLSQFSVRLNNQHFSTNVKNYRQFIADKKRELGKFSESKKKANISVTRLDIKTIFG